jgi:hypothetical protein
VGRQSRISRRVTLVVSTAAIVAATFAGAAPGGGGSSCSKIDRSQLEKQLSFNAERILAGCGGRPAATPDVLFSPLALLVAASPNVYGGGDVDLIAGRPQTYPHVTQSTSQVWAHGSTVIAAYNDSEGAAASPFCLAGGSRSTDGGATWANTHPFCTDSAANFGEPSLVYDAAVSKWMAVFLSAACGAAGLGSWASTDDGVTWARTSCAHVGSSDDKASMWVDGNAGSPFYGRVYVTWNDFAVGGGALRSTFSTDGGSTWTSASTLFGSLRRGVQVTTSPGTDGSVYVDAMDEGGGGLAGPRQNYVYRSTDGGVTWASTTIGSPFLGPGRALCTSYFPGMYTTPVSGYWRTMGWGDIGVGPGPVVHLVYASRPGTGDPGDIDYIRSTDNGATWSAPLKVNTDAGARGQWQPSLAVTSAGHVFVSWYDERNTTGEAGYERFGRLSTDNGATWQADSQVSDVVSPKPLQVDPGLNSCYAGDYDRSYGASGVVHTTWTDGRVAISGQDQQDVFYDKVSTTQTAVRLASFTATRGPRGVALRWRTATETGMLGFNIYRELRGRLTKLNRSLIATRSVRPTGAHVYSWLDSRAVAGPVRYRLQAVSSTGARSWLGAARAR